MTKSRFKSWNTPEFNESDLTRWNWMCSHRKNFKLGKNTDIGAFTYINAKYGVSIGEEVEIGSHCSIYSHSTIDNKRGKVVIGKGARIGSHSVIMPGVRVGARAVVGAFSFINKSVPAGSLAYGIPVKVIKKLK